MPRVSKNAATYTTSEVVSSCDSDSDSVSDFSSDSSAHYGSGDEGVVIPTGNANSIGSTAAPEFSSPGFPAPVRAIVGTFCAATAVAGGIMFIYGGMGNSNFLGDQHDLYRALMLAGGSMLGIGSLVTLLCVVKRPETSGRLAVAWV